AISFAWTSPAYAQDVWGWSIIVPSVTGTDQLGTVLRGLREETQQSSRSGDGKPQQPAPSRQAASNQTGLRFTPSKERRIANQAAFVAEARRIDPKEADNLAAILASQDIFAQVEPLMAN